MVNEYVIPDDAVKGEFFYKNYKTKKYEKISHKDASWLLTCNSNIVYQYDGVVMVSLRR